MTEAAVNPTELGIPVYHEFCDPLLRLMADGQARHRSVMEEGALDAVGLPAELRLLRNKKAGDLVAANRVGFAISVLHRAALLEGTGKRGEWRITDAGREFLVQHPEPFIFADLKALPAWQVWEPKTMKATTSDSDVSAVQTAGEPDLTPEEQMQAGATLLEENVAADLLERLVAQTPGFFETAVVRLLMAMGYGGSEGNATVTQLSNDGGIDGIIDQDALGLARIYVQAKRYGLDQAVGRPDVQAFVGALAGNGASQGVFITTARFSKGAEDFASSVAARVVLIDGRRLTRLMIQYRVGVQVRHSYDVVEIDEDFFE